VSAHKVADQQAQCHDDLAVEIARRRHGDQLSAHKGIALTVSRQSLQIFSCTETLSLNHTICSR
jgi:hypothetical protein